jgi:hypothetical protein
MRKYALLSGHWKNVGELSFHAIHSGAGSLRSILFEGQIKDITDLLPVNIIHFQEYS